MTLYEEDILIKKCGKENPFRTPDNYFDEFPKRVMSRLPQKKRSLRKPFRWAAAAIMTGIAATTGFMLMQGDEQTDYLADKEDNMYIEEMLDYSMIDNTEIATYLTEAE